MLLTSRGPLQCTVEQLVRAGKLMSGPPAVQAVVAALHAAPELLVLVGLTVVIWVMESVFEYLFGILWRNLAQTIEHELRLDALPCGRAGGG